MGPCSPGTAYVLLHHYMGEIDGIFTRMGVRQRRHRQHQQRDCQRGRSFGAEIRCNTPVAHVIVKNGRAIGVALENGDELYADVIVSSLDPKRTFLKLVDEKGSHPNSSQTFDVTKRGLIRQGESRARRAAEFHRDAQTHCPDRAARRGSISPSVEYLERAYDDAKYGNFSQHPYMDMIIPSLIDPDMAPPGKHVMSIFVQYAPYNLNGGWNDAQREAFGDTVVNTLAQYAPNLKDIILHRQVLTPWDIEQITGLTEGNIFVGELALHQLFFLRPSPQWSNYRTPLHNFYQCGAGTHPGGGIMGAGGRLAALEILKDSGA